MSADAPTTSNSPPCHPHAYWECSSSAGGSGHAVCTVCKQPAYSAETTKLIDDINIKHEAQSGASRLQGWFGLSYASFLVLPRILMCAMPDDWQRRMVILLEEYEDTYVKHFKDDCKVLPVGRDGRFKKWPAWVLDYRHPDRAEINKARGQ